MVEKCQNLRNEIKTRWGDSVNLLYSGHKTNKSSRSNLGFLRVDLKFNGQWHAFRVRCQPPCKQSKCDPKMVKLGSCRYAPIFRRRSRLVLGKLCFSDWVTDKIWDMVKGHSEIKWASIRFAVAIPWANLPQGIFLRWVLVSFAVMATLWPSQHNFGHTWLFCPILIRQFYGQWHIFRVRC